MQTRRDQLHAYRFLTKRALAALVTGEPNAVEPPMRRLTVTTISGVMIAVLVGVGFAVFGLIKPTAGDSWKDQSAIIVERETGARYIYRNGELDPMLNYSSAVLAASGSDGTSQAKVVLVDRSEIAGTDHGPTLGIPNIPDSLPDAGDIVDSPWTVCSRQRAVAGSSTEVRAYVSVGVGPGVFDPTPLRSGTAVLVATPATSAGPGTEFMLYEGKRFEVTTPAVASALGLDAATPLTVGTAFVQALDAGTTIATPKIDGLGDAGPDVDGKATIVGQLLHATDTDTYALVLPDGLLSVTPVELALLRTIKNAPPEQQVASNVIFASTQSPTDGPALRADVFRDLPKDLPTAATRPNDVGNVCAGFSDDPDADPTLGVVSSLLPKYEPTTYVQSELSANGRADKVTVSPGHAALVRSSDRSPTVFAVAEPGLKYAFTDPEGTKAFGYGDLQPATLPGQLLALVQPGPALDPTKALTPVTG